MSNEVIQGRENRVSFSSSACDPGTYLLQRLTCTRRLLPNAACSFHCCVLEALGVTCETVCENSECPG